MDIQEVRCGGMDWIELFRVKECWWVLGNVDGYLGMLVGSWECWWVLGNVGGYL